MLKKVLLGPFEVFKAITRETSESFFKIKMLPHFVAQLVIRNAWYMHHAGVRLFSIFKKFYDLPPINILPSFIVQKLIYFLKKVAISN